jgi:hypothetical protein
MTALRRMQWLRVAILMTFLLALMPASPARGGVDGLAAIIQGELRVGDDDGSVVPQDGLCEPTGLGLHFTGLHGAGPQKDKHSLHQFDQRFRYRLAASVTAVAGGVSLVSPVTGQLDACGLLRAGWGGIGASCDQFSGTRGRGKMALSSGAAYQLEALSWRPSAAGVLVVWGYLQRLAPASKTPADARGVVQGLIHVVPTLNCAIPQPGSARRLPARGALHSTTFIETW